MRGPFDMPTPPSGYRWMVEKQPWEDRFEFVPFPTLRVLTVALVPNYSTYIYSYTTKAHARPTPGSVLAAAERVLRRWERRERREKLHDATERAARKRERERLSQDRWQAKRDIRADRVERKYGHLTGQYPPKRSPFGEVS